MDRNKVVKEVRDWIIALGVAIIAALLIRTFLFAPVLVDGQSMMPTLHDQNRMIVNKIGYIVGEPKRGDIVVFHATQDRDYIKRVIGLPGDTIEYKDDVLFINGKEVKEPYLDKYKSQIDEGTLTDNFSLEALHGMKKIPKGEYWLMGDNRRFSQDSRHLGPIKRDKILGKTSLVFWPLNEFRIAD
ncbi:MAG: lepB [Bacillales bacterium]|jgi:signal peptidase I|nr:lepB [Bacillales bacterium]